MIEADSIVLVVGAISNNELADGLKDAPFEVRLIGDCCRIFAGTYRTIAPLQYDFLIS